MVRKYKIGFIALALLLGVIVFLETKQPSPLNWTPSYSRIDKIPLGTYVLYESLSEKFTDNFQKIDLPPYKFLKDTVTKRGTYFFLNSHIFFGESELNEVLDWVHKGNTVYISAHFISENMLDTLNMKLEHLFLPTQLTTEPVVNFTNPELKKVPAFHYPQPANITYFSAIDTSKQVVLGTVSAYTQQQSQNDTLVNFVAAPFGKGKFYIQLFPEGFSNYFILLEDNSTYAERALAYIDFQKPVYWDAYYKVGKPRHSSLLYILLSNKYLKWAYYTLLLSVLLFIFFKAKRNQRSIPIILPKRNQTYDFTQMLSNLYLKEKDHTSIAKKKIHLCMAEIRQRWKIKTATWTKNERLILAERSGNSAEDTLALFDYFEKIQQKKDITSRELLRLHQMIHKFLNPK